MASLAEAIRLEHPDTIPISIGILPSAWIKYGDELQRLVDQYPQFFNGMLVNFFTNEHVEAGKHIYRGEGIPVYRII